MTEKRTLDTLPGTSVCTPAEAAAILGCSLSMVYKLTRAGLLAAYRTGRFYHLYRDGIGDFLTAASVKPETKKPPAAKPKAGRGGRKRIAGRLTPLTHVR